jgi:hypothetical protein
MSHAEKNCAPCSGGLKRAYTVASNVTGAASRIAAAAVSSKKIKVSDEVKEARLAICRACEFHEKHAQNLQYIRCTNCRCWLNGKFFAKASLATERCPIGKWGELK